MIALQAAHPLAHIGQSLAPVPALEQIPERVRIEDPDIATMTAHLDRLMPDGSIEDRGDGIYEGPTHGWTNENIGGTFVQSRIESENGNGRAGDQLSRL